MALPFLFMNSIFTGFSSSIKTGCAIIGDLIMGCSRSREEEGDAAISSLSGVKRFAWMATFSIYLLFQRFLVWIFKSLLLSVMGSCMPEILTITKDFVRERRGNGFMHTLKLWGVTVFRRCLPLAVQATEDLVTKDLSTFITQVLASVISLFFDWTLERLLMPALRRFLRSVKVRRGFSM